MISSIQSLIFSAFLILFTIDGYHACFKKDDYFEIRIATGNDFYQECQCTEPGFKVEYIKWVDNSNQIVTTGPGTDSNIFVERLSDSLNLHIKNISKSISGTFRCIAQYKGQDYVQTFNVEAYDPLHFINTPVKQYLLEGYNTRINCEPKGESDPFISWFKEKGEFVEIHNDDKYEVSPEGLIVNNVTKEDEGIYKCSASLPTSAESLDRYIKIEVMTKPVIRELKPNPGTRLVQGSNLSIECIAEGTPQPEYVWNKISYNDLEDKGNQTWQQHVKTIVFDHITPEDQGTYQCTAYNMVGNVSANISVEVLVPPAINNFDNILGKEDELVQLVCEATGRPKPNVTITMKKKDPDNSRENIIEISLGTILRLKYPSSEGAYTCNARNEVGSVTKEMYVKVLHRPYLYDKNEVIWGWNEKSINFSCMHDSNPQANVTWSFKRNGVMTTEQDNKLYELLLELNNTTEKYLTVTIGNNFPYGVFKCLAENTYGQATKTITIKEGFAPKAVENISVVDMTATSILFSLNGPNDSSRPDVIGYVAEYDEEENFNITNIHVSRTWAVGRPYRVDKLKPNKTYHIRFAAINEVGPGIWSEMFSFHTLEKSVPETPIWDVEGTQLSPNNKQVLKWIAPEDNGEPIDYYALRYCPEYDPFDETLCKEDRIESSTEIELENLKFNTTYYLELIAHNSEGNSTAANTTIYIPAPLFEESSLLPAGAIIGIAIAIVIVCLILLDLLLLLWRRQGIMASCCCKKKEKRTTDLQARDKKGLLRENCESTDSTLKTASKGHKQYEYNKNTGIITGKHSAV